jgi:hypothetical protein
MGKAAAYIIQFGHKKSPKIEHYPLLSGLVKPSLWVFSTANMGKVFGMAKEKPTFIGSAFEYY